MTLLSDLPDTKLFAGTRQTIDLYSTDSIKEFKYNNKIDSVIHCAIEGRGLQDEKEDIVYKNLLMLKNLITTFHDRDDRCFSTPLFINIASGAEFDRRFNISGTEEYMVRVASPIDYYGVSKNIISNIITTLPNGINLRVFGCFYHNELPTRFIRANLTRYIKGEPIIIEKNKKMDFIYMEDLATIIKFIIKNNGCSVKDINMSYKTKLTLLDIANIINNIDDKKSKIVIKNDVADLDYYGNSRIFTYFDDNLKGLELGIKECYEKLKNEY